MSSIMHRLRPGRTGTPSPLTFCTPGTVMWICNTHLAADHKWGLQVPFQKSHNNITQPQSSPSSIHLKCWAYVEFGCKFCCSYKDSKLLCGSSLFESCFGRGFFKMKVSERVHKCKGISKRKMLEHPRS